MSLIEFEGPLSTEFKYITVKDLRREGFDDADLPDDRAEYLIALVSSWINWITKQWFIPIRLRQKVDGRRSSVVHLPTFVPIIELFKLDIAKENLFQVTLPETAFEVRKRFVQMLASATTMLPAEPQFMVMDGVFGWLEDSFSPARTNLTAPVVLEDTTINVVDTTGIRFGESVLVGRDPEPLSGAVIVQGLTPTTLTVSPTRFTALDNDPVVRYGRVPRMIQWATMLLVKDKMLQIGQRGGQFDTSGPPFFERRLNSENIEGYSYNLTPFPVAYGPGGGAFTTGNPEVDDILKQFASGSQMIYVGSTFR